MDSRKRSITKAVIWNLMGFLMMSLVGFVATGSAAVGGTLAIVNTVIGFTLYVVYERIWSAIQWGRHV